MDNTPYSLDPIIIQQITDLIVAAVPADTFRAAIIDVAIKKGGTLSYSGVYISTDYHACLIDLGDNLDQLAKILLAEYWPIKKYCNQSVNKAHFNLDCRTQKLTYSLANDPDLEWLQACQPNDNSRSLSPAIQHGIESWIGLPATHPRPWLHTNKPQGC